MLKGIGITSYNREEDGVEVEVEVGSEEITPELLQELIQAKIASEVEDIRSGSVSVKELDEHRKKVVEFIAKGGDPTELIKIQEKQTELKTYDLDNVDDQEELLFQYYILKTGSEEDARLMVNGAKGSGKLEEHSAAAKKNLEKFFKEQEEAEERKLDEAKKAQADALDKYRKDFRGKVKEKFPEFDDNIVKKLVDSASKKVKQADGNEDYEIDVLYRQKRVNPETAAELALFLKDYDKFVEYITKKEVNKSQLKAVKKVITVRASQGSNSRENNKTAYDKNTSNSIHIDSL